MSISVKVDHCGEIWEYDGKGVTWIGVDNGRRSRQVAGTLEHVLFLEILRLREELSRLVAEPPPSHADMSVAFQEWYKSNPLIRSVRETWLAFRAGVEWQRKHGASE